MLPFAGRERAIVLYFVLRVDPWLFCDGSSELEFRRSLQDCCKLWVIGIGAGAIGRRRSKRVYESYSCILQAIILLEFGNDCLEQIILQWSRPNRGFALARQVGPLHPQTGAGPLVAVPTAPSRVGEDEL